MEEFDLEAFFAWVEASARERAALRQDLVRGLKDYYLYLYGYDRYGAETAFLLAERMSVPYVYGFAVTRLLADRRISVACKIRAAERGLAVTQYGQDMGVPYGLYGALLFLTTHGALSTADLRYALTATGYEHQLFVGMDRHAMAAFIRALLDNEAMPAEERAFWAHSLLTRRTDETGLESMINTVLGHEEMPVALRRELAWAWVHQRQPHLDVPIPPPGESLRDTFVTEHLPFWVAHMRSFTNGRMVRLGLVWLSRLGEDPRTIAEEFLDRSDVYAEQFQYAVADIVSEHAATFTSEQVSAIVERGLAGAASAAVRRKFYSLGSTLLGDSYLKRASQDPAGSVRQWAARVTGRAATG